MTVLFYNFFEPPVYFRKTSISTNPTFFSHELLPFIIREKIGYMLSNFDSSSDPKPIEVKINKKDANYVVLIFGDKLKKCEYENNVFLC